MKLTPILPALLLAAPVWAADAQLGAITVKAPWARETTASAKAGGSYMTIVNDGAQADRLILAASPAAMKVELHSHIKDGDIMRMREVEGGIELPAGGMVMLEPGGFHVMMMGLTGPLVAGESFPLTLTFEHAGELTVTVDVEDIAHVPGDGKPLHKH